MGTTGDGQETDSGGDQCLQFAVNTGTAASMGCVVRQAFSGVYTEAIEAGLDFY